MNGCVIGVNYFEMYGTTVVKKNHCICVCTRSEFYHVSCNGGYIFIETIGLLSKTDYYIFCHLFIWKSPCIIHN